MPQAEVQAFCDDKGVSPFVDWLAQLKRSEPRAWKKCLYLISALESQGRKLSMPRSKPLRDGILELRARVGRVNYRILYGFIGLNVAVVSHGITKEDKVPDGEIDLAIERVRIVKNDTAKHTAEIEF
jgi:phage-related protein